MRFAIRIWVLALGMHFCISPLVAQEDKAEPIIDMHFHGAFVFDEKSVQPIQPWLDAFDTYNIQHAVLTAYPHHLAAWTPQAPGRFIPSVMFPCIRQLLTDDEFTVLLSRLIPTWSVEAFLGRRRVFGNLGKN